MYPSCVAQCMPHALQVAAGVKHFTAYDGPEEGRFSVDAAPPPRDMAATWLAPWRAILRQMGPHPLSGVMASYSAVEGVPICANRRRHLPCLPACLPLPAYISPILPQATHGRTAYRHGLLGLGSLGLRGNYERCYEAPLPAQCHLRRRRRHHCRRRHLL